MGEPSAVQGEAKYRNRPDVGGKREQLFPLDFVRAVGAVLIVIFHYNMVSYDYPDIAKPNLLFVEYANGTMGHIGVSLFFVLTGASLMYVYSDRLEWREYVKKRFLAIFPLYWTVYGAFFVYFYLITGKLTLDLPIWRLLLTLIGMDGYLAYWIPDYYLVGEWFVGCILLMYLCFPFIRQAMVRRPVLTACAAAVLDILLIRFYPFEMDIQFCFLIRIPEMMFGMYFMRYFYGKEENRAGSGWGWGLPSGFLLLLALTVRFRLPLPCKIMLTGIPCFLFLLWLGQRVRGKERAVFTVLSRYSFAIFLTHHILVGKFLFPFSGRTLNLRQDLLVFFVYFLFVCAVSWVLDRLSRVVRRFLEWTISLCGEFPTLFEGRVEGKRE